MGRTTLHETIDEAIMVEKELLSFKDFFGVEELDDYISSREQNNHVKHKSKSKKKEKEDMHSLHQIILKISNEIGNLRNASKKLLLEKASQKEPSSTNSTTFTWDRF
jgi:flagellar motor switch/type III secretory pathway protein FliN